MRQILFKAKRVDNGEWVEGFYEYNKDDDMHFIRTYENRETIEVVPEMVCQYSWITDCKDIKIFDDDIRKDNEGTKFRTFTTNPLTHATTNDCHNDSLHSEMLFDGGKDAE